MEPQAADRDHGCKSCLMAQLSSGFCTQNRSCDHVIEFHSHCRPRPLESMITKSLQTSHAFHYSSHFKPLTEGGLITLGGHSTLPEWWILACCTSSYKSRNQLKLLQTIWETVLWCRLVLNTWNIFDFLWFTELITSSPLWSPQRWLIAAAQIK